MGILNYQPNYQALTGQGANPEQPEPQEQGRFGDSIDQLQAGALGALGGILDFAGAEGLAKDVYGSRDSRGS